MGGEQRKKLLEASEMAREAIQSVRKSVDRGEDLVGKDLLILLLPEGEYRPRMTEVIRGSGFVIGPIKKTSFDPSNGGPRTLRILLEEERFPSGFGEITHMGNRLFAETGDGKQCVIVMAQERGPYSDFDTVLALWREVLEGRVSDLRNA